MTRRQKQSKFASMVGLLIAFAYEQGYELTFGDTWAFNLWSFVLPLLKPILTGRQYKNLLARAHKKGSFHYRRLAIDLNLFWEGQYLLSTKAHEPLGLFWESLGGTWGGRFKGKDGNHYSYGEKKR